MASELERQLKQIHQEQVLQFYSTFDDEEKTAFLAHLQSVDIEEATALFTKAKSILNQSFDVSAMEPIPASQFESEESCNISTLKNYEKLGLEKVSRGEVGVLLMAGGQGTRLGVTYPKGMYNVGLPSNKTLFQIQAERIQRVQQLATRLTGNVGKITWYIMTSGPTDLETDNFLKAHNFFGLNPEDVVQFKQGLLPCFDFNGRILLESRNTIALAPDGNGGIYRALQKNGILDDMKRRGVKYIHAHSVDNILIKIADPVFIGYCLSKGSDCGAKVCKKAGPTEPVGVVCKVNDRFQVVEYSEISAEVANLRDQDGNLVYSAGNICNHFFTVDFLRKVCDRYESQLKLHVAKKKIAYVNEQGDVVKPDKPNGIKIEKFVFDVFPFSDNFVTWEVPRRSEFSAMKNADSALQDCPMTAKQDLLKLHKYYIEKAGGKVLQGDVEISPLLSYAGEDLEGVVKGREFRETTVLWSDSEKSTVNGQL